ncbi:MAG: hypothetical protein ACREND_07865 [Gemmatimonadaceae bacterium]
MKRAFHLSAGRRGVSRDVEHELAFHLEMRTRELVALGRSEARAPRSARRLRRCVDGPQRMPH